jgi:hypothetical protein
MKHSSSKVNAAAQPGWKKAAVLVAAGLVSFVLAIAMQGTWQAGDADLDLAAAPRQRAASAQINAAPSHTGPAEAPRLEAAMHSPGQRMNKMVVRDPFGPLATEAALPAKVLAPSVAPSPPGKLRKPPAESLPPAPPTAPPLPFTAVGSIQGKRIGNGQQQAFIQHGDALTVIQKGDTVAGNYRVDDITPDHVVFTYLPLGQKQSLLLLDTPR